MDRTTLLLALLTFIVVALATPVQILGLPLAPIAGLIIGMYAGWRAARGHIPSGAGDGLRAGALVGLGALLGSVIALTVMAAVIGSLPGVQDAVRLSEPHPEARIPVEMIAPLAALGGVVGGLALGLVELALAALGGAAGALIYTQRHPA